MAQQQNGALTEKSIIKELKAQFTPFYNLYTKAQLEEKVSCYNQFAKDPQNYYQCVRQVEQRLMKDSDFLRQTFGKIDIDVREGQRSCRTNFPGEAYKDRYTTCYQQLLVKMLVDSKGVYQNFYKKKVGGRRGFRSL